MAGWAAVAETGGDRIAVVDGERRLTFAELDRRVRAVAGGLRAAGVVPGERVAYQLPTCIELLVLQLAIWRVGAVPVPVFIGLKSGELCARLEAAEAVGLAVPVAFRGQAYASVVRELRPRLPCLRRAWAVSVPDELPQPTDGLSPYEELEGGSACDELPSAPDDPALIMFSSGTEGTPKGVVHTRSTVAAFIRMLQTAGGLGPSDVSLVLPPMTLALGLISSVLAPLFVGARVVLLRQFRAEDALRACADEHVTLLTGTPTHYRTLLDVPDLAPASVVSVRLAVVGGDYAQPGTLRQLAERFGCQVMVRWGLTEGALTATALDDPLERVLTTSGRPMPGVELQVRAETGALLGSGESGVLWARSPALFRRYLDDPAGTAAVFDAEGWFCTGDIGNVDAQGYLRFIGRRKDIIVRGGMKISPAEIEQHLALHPAIGRCAMVGMPDRRLGERGCLFAVASTSARPALAELIAHLRERGVAEYKLPERLEWVDELPMTATLKVRKDELRLAIAARLRDEGTP